MLRLNRKGLRGTVRPSGHVIRSTFNGIAAGGSIPSNVIEDDGDAPESMMKMGNNAANDLYTQRCKEQKVTIHPARFPAALPRFFVKMLTEPDDIVYDPFEGSLTTGIVAEDLGRRWIAGEVEEDYLRAGRFRFESNERAPKLF